MDTQDGERCGRGLPSASRPECPLPELEIQKKEKKTRRQTETGSTSPGSKSADSCRTAKSASCSSPANSHPTRHRKARTPAHCDRMCPESGGTIPPRGNAYLVRPVSSHRDV